MVRRGTVRLPLDVAARVRAGHPWVYRETLGSRTIQDEVVELVDANGDFVGRGVHDEEGAIAIRVFTRDPHETVGPALVARRVAEAARLRRRFLPPDLDAFRLVNGESDGLPGFAVDRYGDYLVAHLFTPSVLSLKDGLYDALEAEWKPKAIYEQRRFRPVATDGPRGGADLVRGTVAPVELEVNEGGLKFWVDVTAPMSTGLFLDLREGRRQVAAWSSGLRVLNLFSYTGAISVYAAHGGAKEIVAVDVSAKAHARARRNFSLNGLDPEKPEHMVGDAFKVLARFQERKRRFDMVILDPPAFGTAGRGNVFSAAQDYRDLVAEALLVLEPGGLLFAASSTHKISSEELDRALAEGAARAGTSLRIVERRSLPPDYPVAAGFPEGNYLKLSLAVRS